MTGEPTDRKGSLELPFWRLQWKKLVVVLDDHPRLSLAVVGGLLVLLWVYAVPMRGMAHAVESLKRWKLEVVGGEYSIDRTVRIYDVLLSFEPEPHDRLDVVSMGGLPLVGSAFRSELETVIKGRDGEVRFLALDPRVGEIGHASHGRFLDLAEELGQEPWEFRAALWHACAVLLRLRESLGDRFEIRFVATADDAVEAPYFVGARWVNAYESGDPTQRMDLFSLGESGEPGEDFTARGATLIIDRPESAKVLELGRRFEKNWESANVVDGVLLGELMKQLGGEWRER